MALKNKIQHVLLGFILGTCFMQVVQTRSIDPEIQKQIDDFITNVYLPESKISKMGLSIVQDNGEVLYSTGYGMADDEQGIPNGNTTQFLIGSATKSFTATVVIKVLHEMFPEIGEAVLDTPIRKLIPSVNFTLNDRFRSEHATFRDLIAHRMCLFRDDLQLVSEPFETAEEIVYRQRYAEEICGMRTEFKYNNQMYVMAGELIAILANKTYTELIDSLLQDIGMHNSSLVSKADDFPNMPFRAQPYYMLDNVSHPINRDLIKRVTVSNPAGGMCATPDDMVKYMRFHLNKGNLDGKQIVPAEVMSWMTKPSNLMTSVKSKSSEDDLVVATFGYGLGLALGSYDGWQYIYHTGLFPPYRTLMSLFPSQNLAIFTSTNEGPLLVEPTVLHTFIFEVLKGTPNAMETASKNMGAQEVRRKETEAKKEKSLQRFLEESKAKSKKQAPKTSEIIGKYGSGSSGDVEISEKLNNQTNTTELYVSYGKWYKGWLKNAGGSIYSITWDTDIIQDNYASGDATGLGYLRVENETLEFVTPSEDAYTALGKFKLGVSLDTLPPIPYTPESCGPEVK